MIEALAILLLLAAWTGSALFLVMYSMRHRWWREDVGWYLAPMQFVLLVLASNALAFRWLGEFPGRKWINLAAFVIWVAAVWWFNLIAHREYRRRERPEAGRHGAR